MLVVLQYIIPIPIHMAHVLIFGKELKIAVVFMIKSSIILAQHTNALILNDLILYKYVIIKKHELNFK